MNNSDLLFIKVGENDDAVCDIYEIIKACGRDMFENQGLVHWKTPYPIENIKSDCKNQSVFIVLKDKAPVATFMLSINDKGVMLSKLAVSPKASGCGIGSRCLSFAEDWCRENNIFNFHLSVYDQSKKAIDFYLHNGFVIYGNAPTRHFRVLLMEKNLK